MIFIYSSKLFLVLERNSPDSYCMDVENKNREKSKSLSIKYTLTIGMDFNILLCFWYFSLVNY